MRVRTSALTFGVHNLTAMQVSGDTMQALKGRVHLPTFAILRFLSYHFDSLSNGCYSKLCQPDPAEATAASAALPEVAAAPPQACLSHRLPQARQAAGLSQAVKFLLCLNNKSLAAITKVTESNTAV